MKAKLIYIAFAVRVVVEDNATDDEEIMEAKSTALANFNSDYSSYVEEVKDDTEIPYGLGCA